jgi:hypothetical protein
MNENCMKKEKEKEKEKGKGKEKEKRNMMDTFGDEYEERYYIVIHEIFNRNFHGFTNESEPSIETHFLILESFDYKENYNNSLEIFFREIHQIAREYKTNFLYNHRFQRHCFIRNYNTLIKHKNYMTPEIAKCILLPTGERICILKTFWLRIFQRKWKKIYKQRMEVLNRRKKISSICYREIMGRWPKDCFHF